MKKCAFCAGNLADIDDLHDSCTKCRKCDGKCPCAAWKLLSDSLWSNTSTEKYFACFDGVLGAFEVRHFESSFRI